MATNQCIPLLLEEFSEFSNEQGLVLYIVNGRVFVSVEKVKYVAEDLRQVRCPTNGNEGSTIILRLKLIVNRLGKSRLAQSPNSNHRNYLHLSAAAAAAGDVRISIAVRRRQKHVCKFSLRLLDADELRRFFVHVRKARIRLRRRGRQSHRNREPVMAVSHLLESLLHFLDGAGDGVALLALVEQLGHLLSETFAQAILVLSWGVYVDDADKEGVEDVLHDVGQLPDGHAPRA